MKGILTATCLAASFAVGLAAQSTSSATQTPPAEPQRGGGPRTVTGCLRAGDTADTYMLTDVQMPARPGDTTAGATAGGGTTAGGTGAAAQGDRAMPTSITLMPAADVDLKPHVGHKIEVTGTPAGRGRGGNAAAGGTSTTTGGTSTTTGGTGTTAGGTTSGTATTGSSTADTGQGRSGRGGPRGMNVTSVRMISESCS